MEFVSCSIFVRDLGLDIAIIEQWLTDPCVISHRGEGFADFLPGCEEACDADEAFFIICVNFRSPQSISLKPQITFVYHNLFENMWDQFSSGLL